MINITMRGEILRQLVHLSGLAFIYIAWLTNKIAAGFLFLMIALSFLLYSEYVMSKERSSKSPLHKMESRLRDFALFFERKEAKRPFTGAFWFYLGLGLAFLLFPLEAASAAGAVLAISDSVSTMVGKKFGRRKIAGKKTLEGTLAFFISGFLVCLVFVNPPASLAATLAATLAELLPEASSVSRSKFSGLVDDNFLIPIISGFVLAVMVAV